MDAESIFEAMMMLMMMLSVPNGQRGPAVLGTRRLFASSVLDAHGSIDTSVSCGWIRTYPRYVRSFSSNAARLRGLLGFNTRKFCP